MVINNLNKTFIRLAECTLSDVNINESPTLFNSFCDESSKRGGGWNSGAHRVTDKQTTTKTLTQAFTPLLASLVITVTLLPHQHSLQLLPLLLLPLAGKLRAGLLVLQHVLNVLSHLLKVTVLC